MAHGPLEIALVAESLGDELSAVAAQLMPLAAHRLAARHVGTDTHVWNASSHDANTCGNFGAHARVRLSDSLIMAEYQKTLLPQRHVCSQPPNSPNSDSVECFVLWLC